MVFVFAAQHAFLEDLHPRGSGVPPSSPGAGLPLEHHTLEVILTKEEIQSPASAAPRSP